jgi:D-amino-acid dehydrogenase
MRARSQLLAKGGWSAAPSHRGDAAIEPTLSGTFYGGYFTESDSTGDIHKFTSGLAAACERLGVQCRYGQEIVGERGKQASVTVRQGWKPKPRLSTPWWSAQARPAALAAQLGDSVNIYPVKGYSITVNLPDEASRAAAPW